MADKTIYDYDNVVDTTTGADYRTDDDYIERACIDGFERKQTVALLKEELANSLRTIFSPPQEFVDNVKNDVKCVVSYDFALGGQQDLDVIVKDNPNRKIIFGGTGISPINGSDGVLTNYYKLDFEGFNDGDLVYLDVSFDFDDAYVDPKVISILMIEANDPLNAKVAYSRVDFKNEFGFIQAGGPVYNGWYKVIIQGDTAPYQYITLAKL